jgi:hypothetical protein
MPPLFPGARLSGRYSAHCTSSRVRTGCGCVAKARYKSPHTDDRTTPVPHPPPTSRHICNRLQHRSNQRSPLGRPVTLLLLRTPLKLLVSTSSPLWTTSSLPIPPPPHLSFCRPAGKQRSQPILSSYRRYMPILPFRPISLHRSSHRHRTGHHHPDGSLRHIRPVPQPLHLSTPSIPRTAAPFGSIPVLRSVATAQEDAAAVRVLGIRSTATAAPRVSSTSAVLVLCPQPVRLVPWPASAASATAAAASAAGGDAADGSGSAERKLLLACARAAGARARAGERGEVWTGGGEEVRD